MNEGTTLVELCVGSYESLKASFTLSNGESMLVEHLSGKDEAGCEEFVKAKGGPWELVAGWLQKHQLWRFLRDYKSPNSKRPHLSVREGRETDSCSLCTFSFLTSFSSGDGGGPVRCLCRLQCLSFWFVD